MIRSFSLVLISAGVLLLAAPSFAADDKKPDTTAKADATSPEALHSALFDKLDANHDGFITTDEVPAEHRRLFDRLLRRADKNGDGKLSREEFMAGMAEDHSADRPAGPPPDRHADKDKPNDQASGPREGKGFGPDGAGAKGFAGPGRPAERMMMGMVIFHALDTNGDGKLDEKEIAAASESLKKLAKNGEITRDDLMKAAHEAMGGAFGGENRLAFGGAGQPEANPDEVVKRMIKRFDKNGDGKLQKDELPTRLQEHFDQFDTNHDGALDEAELKAALPEFMRHFAEQRGESADRPRTRPGSSDDKKPDDNTPKNN